MQVQRLRDALTEFGPERCSLGAGPTVEQLCSQLRQEVRSVVHAGNVCKWVPPSTPLQQLHAHLLGEIAASSIPMAGA